ncbi:natural cytotoxicity triggering receptor 2-like isoform X2 [Poecilia latipinna]|uniref:natural cytotoxicity triggering receptor 2-like isoform X2 n=1 Tax=Poecilia latipinna TaxID=48699 RepID=UPI00072E5F16|nr:PREDICTED: natural cytotoxicity triggering receptor 2-like isoform X2 [Poecilia latipinna]
MKVCLTLICLLFLKLQDGNAVRRETGVEGGNIAVTCPFLLSGSRKFVCKDKCGGENILIETTNNTAERGRYSVKYERNIIIFKDFLYFTIKDLKKSDSGRYRCRLDETWTGTRYEDFELVVNEGTPGSVSVFTTSTTTEPNWTLQTFTTSTVLPTSFRTASVQSSSPPSSSKTIQAPAAPGLLLPVVLVLAILIITLAVALLNFFQKKHFGQKKGPLVKTEYSDPTKVSTVYDEIRLEERENETPPQEKSPVYSLVRSCEPNRADLYSLAGCPKNDVEVDAVDYAEVHFPTNTTTSSNSAPCGHAVNVTCSEPLSAVGSANLSDDSSALYSNVTCCG